MRRAFLKKYYNHGFSLVESVVTLFIIITSLTVAMNILLQTKKLTKQLEIVASIGLIRNNIFNIISSDASWQTTVQNPANGNFNCIQSGPAGDCTGIANLPFSLYGADGTLFYDSGNALASNGFNLKGEPCTNFDAANGTISCPYHVTINWTSICPALPTACTGNNVLIKVAVNFQTSFPTVMNYPFNESRFNISLVRNRLP